jgi:hypothetical protein
MKQNTLQDLLFIVYFVWLLMHFFQLGSLGHLGSHMHKEGLSASMNIMERKSNEGKLKIS